MVMDEFSSAVSLNAGMADDGWITRINGADDWSFPEFETFVKHTENQLYRLFKSIDLDGDGKLDRSEIRNAFHEAGLAVPNSKLDKFFEEVDTNRDGVITFDEWRYAFFFFFTMQRSTFLSAF